MNTEITEIPIQRLSVSEADGKIISPKNVEVPVFYTGKSAYALAVDEGYAGTLQQWLLSLKGEDGLSAYQVWLSLGNIGTSQDFINSLKINHTHTISEISGLQAQLDAKAEMSTGDRLSNGEGVFGQISITDDYMYICVKTGSAGNAVWKKTVLFQI